MLSLIFIVCIEKELNQNLMTPNYNATYFFFHQKALEANDIGGRGAGARDNAVVRALASHQCGPG